jgi:hypothetical protein
LFQKQIGFENKWKLKKERSECFKTNIKAVYTAHTDLIETKLQHKRLIVGCRLNGNTVYKRNPVGKQPP